MQKLKVLVTIIAVVFGVAILDSLLSLGLNDGFYVLLGGIQLVCIIWALVLVYKKE